MGEERSYQFSSVQFSRWVMSDSLRPHEQQHARPPCLSSTLRVYPDSCPLSQWCHLTISSSVVPFSSCLKSFPTSESFQMNQLFASGGQRIGASASSVLPMNIQDGSPLEWTGWISLQSKWLSRLFSNTTVQKHQMVPIKLNFEFYKMFTWHRTIIFLMLKVVCIHVYDTERPSLSCFIYIYIYIYIYIKHS